MHDPDPLPIDPPLVPKRFTVEIYTPGDGALGNRWHVIAYDTSRRYCEGYLAAYMQDTPRRAVRLRNGEGKILDERPAYDEVSGGAMPAGFGFQWPYLLSAAERTITHARSDIAFHRREPGTPGRLMLIDTVLDTLRNILKRPDDTP